MQSSIKNQPLNLHKRGLNIFSLGEFDQKTQVSNTSSFCQNSSSKIPLQNSAEVIFFSTSNPFLSESIKGNPPLSGILSYYPPPQNSEWGWDWPVVLPDLEKVNLSNIPKELRQHKQWTLWKSTPNPKRAKPDKVPYRSRKFKASSTNPSTWNSFENISKIYQSDDCFSGIMFILSSEDPFVGIDIDDCIKDGKLSDLAKEIVNEFQTYTEISPSGQGLRLFVYGKLPADNWKKLTGLGLEMYEEKRPLTLTGNALNSLPIADRQVEIDWLQTKYRKPKKEPSSTPTPQPSSLSLTDQEIIDKASNAKNGGKFQTLYNGNWSAAGYSSQSEGDAAFVFLLYFYCDESQIDRIFRTSGLYREKWEREDYRRDIFNGAKSKVTQRYKPKFRRTKKKDSLPVEPHFDQTDRIDLALAQKEVKQLIDDFFKLADLSKEELSQLEARDKNKILVVDVGFGKTHTVIENLDKEKTVHILAPTHTLAKQIHKRIQEKNPDLRGMVLQGRTQEGLCPDKGDIEIEDENGDKVKLLELLPRLGLSIFENCCQTKDSYGGVHKCKSFDACPYLAQFRQEKPYDYIIGTHNELTIPRRKGQKLKEPDLLIVDEKCFDKVGRILNINVDNISHDISVDTRNIFDEVIEILKKSISEKTVPEYIREKGITKADITSAKEDAYKNLAKQKVNLSPMMSQKKPD